MQIDLHLGECRSLKAKRAIVKPIVEGAKRRFGVACAEVDANDSWQLASLGVAVVSNRAHHAEEVLDEVERFIWSTPGIQVLRSDRHWLEHER
ncbi:DUF503 domain-containing protein [Actinomarinicola tropica]|nr:DUF503 domain-containing protein [Actinomarinicola tropica]